MSMLAKSAPSQNMATRSVGKESTMQHSVTFALDDIL